MGLESDVTGTYYPLKIKEGISRISSSSKNIVDKLFKITWPNHYDVLDIIERRLKHNNFNNKEISGFICALSELIQNQGIEYKKSGTPEKTIFVGFFQHESLVSSYVSGNSRESIYKIALERVNKPFVPSVRGMGLPSVGLFSDDVYISEYLNRDNSIQVEMKIFKKFS